MYFLCLFTNTQRKKAERVIRHMAHFDSLTGLANRAYFIEKLEGNFDNVVGLPVQLVLRMLNELKQHPETHKVL